MDAFDYVFKWRREPDGTGVSQPELRRLQAAQRQADATDIHAPADDIPGLQLEEQQREARMQHIRARLFAAFGRAKADFNQAQSRGHER